MESKGILTVVFGVLFVLCFAVLIYFYAVPYNKASTDLQTVQTQLTELRAQAETDRSAREAQEVMEAEAPKRQLIGTVFFNSGDIQLTTSGLSTLSSLEEVFRANSDKIVIIEGHTDNVRLGQYLRSRFNSNLDLSAARALRVARFCANRLGVQPEQITVAAFSEYRPVADNTSNEERRKNRRVEIFLEPRN